MSLNLLAGLIVINLVIVLIYAVFYQIFGKQNKAGLGIKAAFMIICPILGPCFLLLGFLIYKLCFSQAAVLPDKVFHKEKAQTIIRADEEQERDIVSLEEALAVTDKENLRKLMLNVVRGDVRNSLGTIAKALDSTDTETAHYAAAVLQEELNHFRDYVQKNIAFVKIGNVNQAFYAASLIDYMNDILKQHVFADGEQKSYVMILEEVAEILYQNDPENVSGSQYEAVCMRLLEVGEYERCALWCERSRQQYPKLLSSYACQLKLYFSTQEREKFFEVLTALKQSDVVIDNETLEMIRVFQ